MSLSGKSISDSPDCSSRATSESSEPHPTAVVLGAVRPPGGAEVEGADDGRARGGDESREDGVEDVGEVGEDVGRG